MKVVRSSRWVLREAVIITSLLWFILMIVLIFVHEQMLSGVDENQIKLLLNKYEIKDSNLTKASASAKNIKTHNTNAARIVKVQTWNKSESIPEQSNADRQSKHIPVTGHGMVTKKRIVPDFILKQIGNDPYAGESMY